MTVYRNRIRQSAVALVAAVGLLAPAAFANQWNERTINEVSEPVMVPGATLQPGRYIFKLRLDADNEVVVELTQKPVLVASRIVGGNNNVALSIRAQARVDRAGEAGSAVGTSGTAGATGTSGSTASATLTDARSIVSGDEDLVGRRVRLQNVQLSAGKERGLWLTTSGQRIYVLPSQATSTPASAGAGVTVEGVVLQMPRAMRTRLNPGGEWNDEVYIYAFDVHR